MFLKQNFNTRLLLITNYLDKTNRFSKTERCIVKRIYGLSRTSYSVKEKKTIIKM